MPPVGRRHARYELSDTANKDGDSSSPQRMRMSLGFVLGGNEVGAMVIDPNPAPRDAWSTETEITAPSPPPMPPPKRPRTPSRRSIDSVVLHVVEEEDEGPDDAIRVRRHGSITSAGRITPSAGGRATPLSGGRATPVSPGGRLTPGSPGGSLIEESEGEEDQVAETFFGGIMPIEILPGMVVDFVNHEPMSIWRPVQEQHVFNPAKLTPTDPGPPVRAPARPPARPPSPVLQHQDSVVSTTSTTSTTKYKKRKKRGKDGGE